jgi:hypothetical protein
VQNSDYENITAKFLRKTSISFYRDKHRTPDTYYTLCNDAVWNRLSDRDLGSFSTGLVDRPQAPESNTEDLEEKSDATAKPNT